MHGECSFQSRKAANRVTKTTAATATNLSRGAKTATLTSEAEDEEVEPRLQPLRMPGTPNDSDKVIMETDSTAAGVRPMTGLPKQNQECLSNSENVEVCPICCECIVDATEDSEGQEALFCDGNC